MWRSCLDHSSLCWGSKFIVVGLGLHHRLADDAFGIPLAPFAELGGVAELMQRTQIPIIEIEARSSVKESRY